MKVCFNLCGITLGNRNQRNEAILCLLQFDCGHMVLVSHIEASIHGALTLAASFVCSQLEAWITSTLITA